MKTSWFIGFILVLSLTAGAARAENRFAFVVGNDAYVNVDPLKKAVNDARSVGRSLQQLGFQVTLGENLGWRDFVQKFSSFENSIQPGDTAFLFYAGHAVEIDGANFLVPTDAPRVAAQEQQSLLRDLTISTDNLIQRLKSRGTRIQIIVLDACRDNPFRLTNGRSVGGLRGLARTSIPGGVFIIYSADFGESAMDRLSDSDTNANSVFTRSFLPLLEDPGNSLVAVAKQTRAKVKGLASTVGQTQSPAYYDGVDGDIFLSRQASQATTPPIQIPPPVAQPEKPRVPGPVASATNESIPPPPAPAPTSRSAQDFMFANSDSVLLTRAMLINLSPDQLRIARNEIYARRGRFFRDPALSAHFKRFGWYRPYAWEVPLNAVEKANVSLIASLER
ncbi:caspase family protein [Bradyrhizobium sp. LjRoot220]|uniref:caspase family protein n=1 Tax=Bradyrhizobium sp. LjRoot220 TaxID=3342284 RepID=UPI003ED0F966